MLTEQAQFKPREESMAKDYSEYWICGHALLRAPKDCMPAPRLFPPDQLTCPVCGDRKPEATIPAVLVGEPSNYPYASALATLPAEQRSEGGG